MVIEEVESNLEGDIDLRGFLGTDKSVRNRFQNIRMSFDICADLSDQESRPEATPILCRKSASFSWIRTRHVAQQRHTAKALQSPAPRT
jgi:hypothetical protein